MASLSFACVLAGSHAAEAYCLTTTVSEPRGWDPEAQGCFHEGAVLAWPDAPIDLHVDAVASRKVPFDVAQRALDAAFERWSSVVCDVPGALSTAVVHPRFHVRNLGPLTVDLSDCTTEECARDRLAEQRLLVFRDDEWPNAEGAITYALTTVTYRVGSGRVAGAFIEVNTADHDFVEHGPTGGDVAALDYVLTHEAGHFLGLAHSDRADAIMNRLYHPEREATLLRDDEAAICSIRTAAPPEAARAGCGCGVPSSGPHHGWLLGLGLAALVVRRSHRVR